MLVKIMLEVGNIINLGKKKGKICDDKLHMEFPMDHRPKTIRIFIYM